MKTIFVDDELWMMKMFEEESAGLPDIDIIGNFDSSKEALDFAKENIIELAFLDIGMPIMNGIELAKKLRELYPSIIIIFVSAYEEHMAEAFRTRTADYYILKPYQHDDIAAAIDRAKLLSKRLSKRVKIQTFGRFVVYVDDKEVKFSSKKAKEILAYLVDKKGNAVSNDEIYSVLWEDRPIGYPEFNVFYNALERLQKILKQYGAEDLLITLPSELKINTEIVECSYWDFLDGNTDVLKTFDGEYMANYSWAEETTANLYASKQQLCG